MKRLNLFPIRHIVKKEDTYNLLILLSSLIYSKHVGQKMNKKNSLLGILSKNIYVYLNMI